MDGDPAGYRHWAPNEPNNINAERHAYIYADGRPEPGKWNNYFDQNSDPLRAGYWKDTTVDLTATPAVGWEFLEWRGHAVGSSAEVSIQMASDTCVEAVFGTTSDALPSMGGTITLDPAASTYPYGTPVKLIAAPEPGFYFSGWGGAAPGSVNPSLLTVIDANSTVSESLLALGANEASLTVIPEGGGSVVRNPPANKFTLEQNVTLLALPNRGQDFLGWGSDATGTQNPLVVTMDASKFITARFTARPRLDVVTCLGRVDSGVFRLMLNGEFGAVYRIDGSSNLVDWVKAGTVTNTYGTVQFDDAVGIGVGQRFYRPVQVP